eukprot:gene6140-biopygen11841
MGDWICKNCKVALALLGQVLQPCFLLLAARRLQLLLDAVDVQIQPRAHVAHVLRGLADRRVHEAEPHQEQLQPDVHEAGSDMCRHAQCASEHWFLVWNQGGGAVSRRERRRTQRPPRWLIDSKQQFRTRRCLSERPGSAFSDMMRSVIPVLAAEAGPVPEVHVGLPVCAPRREALLDLLLAEPALRLRPVLGGHLLPRPAAAPRQLLVGGCSLLHQPVHAVFADAVQLTDASRARALLQLGQDPPVLLLLALLAVLLEILGSQWRGQQHKTHQTCARSFPPVDHPVHQAEEAPCRAQAPG